jgi:hypothetical protein
MTKFNYSFPTTTALNSVSRLEGKKTTLKFSSYIKNIYKEGHKDPYPSLNELINKVLGCLNTFAIILC